MPKKKYLAFVRCIWCDPKKQTRLCQIKIALRWSGVVCDPKKQTRLCQTKIALRWSGVVGVAKKVNYILL